MWLGRECASQQPCWPVRYGEMSQRIARSDDETRHIDGEAIPACHVRTHDNMGRGATRLLRDSGTGYRIATIALRSYLNCAYMHQQLMLSHMAILTLVLR